MNNAAKILSTFEEKLISIIDLKEKTAKEMLKHDEICFEQYGKKDPESIRLHKLFQQQPKTFQTGIHLEIDSEKLAEDVHRKILELIKEKAYPVEEVLWVNFASSTIWNFTFNY